MYPVMLHLCSKPIVVIGGGAVAERKVVGLLDGGATAITLVSPEITDTLRELVREGIVVWQQKQYEKNDLEGAFLIIAATDCASVNTEVLQGKAPNQLVNIADNPGQSDFQVPAVYRNGDLSIAISTGGASPMLAKKIKRDIAHLFDEEYNEFIKFLSMARQRILAEISDPGKKRVLLREVMSDRFLSSGSRAELFEELLRRR
ncbi:MULTISPECIES: precorrin-2 dehydrogenase/sirohydrochlorin ferrochelatase family protein [Bacillaceae]|uniref:precorrin-2 dehydrogenase n=1 Tax=Evansella alkalicola TaxID=745819 RepID=A0ABS6JMT5_9BACI|nr:MULTISPECIES: NAD(P)-dependent oxidoreductase [Bacillaceae]MBU9719870.1 siroheme synthase [Bacillus alkalicola]